MINKQVLPYIRVRLHSYTLKGLCRGMNFEKKSSKKVHYPHGWLLPTCMHVPFEGIENSFTVRSMMNSTVDHSRGTLCINNTRSQLLCINNTRSQLLCINNTRSQLLCINNTRIDLQEGALALVRYYCSNKILHFILSSTHVYYLKVFRIASKIDDAGTFHYLWYSRIDIKKFKISLKITPWLSNSSKLQLTPRRWRALCGKPVTSRLFMRGAGETSYLCYGESATSPYRWYRKLRTPRIVSGESPIS
jgi:hypothetical protein